MAFVLTAKKYKS